jgi:M6 family metalloprotease-like protein
MLATHARCRTILRALAAALAAAAAPFHGPAAAAPSHGPPPHELHGRIDGGVPQGSLASPVARRKGLAVVADFADARLEDWQGPGIKNVAQLEDQLRRMEEHWAWLSRGLETFSWDVARVTLPVDLRPDAYAGWGEYRDVVASLARRTVDVPRYDLNHDGVIDTMWVIASSNGCTGCDFIIGGASRNAGANIFVDGQDSLSVAVGATGNFNHEAAHTIGVPDLYGPYGTISYLSVMADSWANPPNDFTSYERALLGWVEPQPVGRTRRNLTLSPRDGGRRAIRVPTAHQPEYFLIEHRRRTASGFGSTAPVPYDGLAVYHVLEGSGQNTDPPLLKLEPADGSIRPDTSPEQTDLFYPGNPGMRMPVVFRSYFGNQSVFRLVNLRRTRDGGLAFDIEIAPSGLPPNILTNPSFEKGSRGSPAAWESGAFRASAVFRLDTGIARSGLRGVSISAPTPNDAWWAQRVSGLTPGRSYAFCGWLRGKNIATGSDAAVGANVSVLGGFVSSAGRSGTFDWAESCVAFRPEASDVQLACRLGFYGSTVTGKMWCDDMSLTALRSAF